MAGKRALQRVLQPAAPPGGDDVGATAQDPGAADTLRMHTQPLFAVEERSQLLQLMRAYPLATLFTVENGVAQADLLPLEVCDLGPHGTLRGHVARSHSLWGSRAAGAGASVATIVFQGPNAYISPRWYVNGQRSRRLAPSWNYVAVQAQGTLRFIDDPAWVVSHLAALTASQEEGREGREGQEGRHAGQGGHGEQAWSLADASPEFVADAAQRLGGFEIEIHTLSGKRFLSQQRTEADRRSVVENLQREASPSARALAALIKP
jgi:transcriptional regulator